MKEPEIKLFGRKILLPENGGAVTGGDSALSSGESNTESGGAVDIEEADGEKADVVKERRAEEDQPAEHSESKPQEKDQENPGKAEEQQNPKTSSDSNENPKTPSINEEDVVSEDHQKPENGQQKTLKKPDKILPCPRCNSMDTKFCYYNNYNINQPRHFCKSCQRYWTAGGTMRNVPVGAGRRKSKNSSSHCRHITISEALQAAQIDPPNGLHHIPGFKPNGTVLSFGPDSPLCESLASGLNLADKRVPNGVRNGYYPSKNGETGDDRSIGSSVTTTATTTNGGGKKGPQKLVIQNVNGFPSPVPCIPAAPWPFLCPPGYPMQFYPSPYWNCGIPNPWNVPWLSIPSPTHNQNSTGSSLGSSSGSNSPLGKHSRNGELLKPSSSEGKEHMEQKNIVVPKTLRINDPEEAAKSPIWEALGIKYDSLSREGLFKALQPKGNEKKVMVSASPVLQANPAALSRSINFQEGV